MVVSDSDIDSTCSAIMSARPSTPAGGTRAPQNQRAEQTTDAFFLALTESRPVRPYDPSDDVAAVHADTHVDVETKRLPTLTQCGMQRRREAQDVFKVLPRAPRLGSQVDVRPRRQRACLRRLMRSTPLDVIIIINAVE